MVSSLSMNRMARFCEMLEPIDGKAFFLAENLTIKGEIHVVQRHCEKV